MPSSYQHNHLGRQHYREIGCPDYLTCGCCSKEFLLENITLFIAHKSTCDISTSLSGKLRHDWDDLQDASSPLTCSTCSRVYVTARGLLHHVQKVHRMNICLQKGPLIISDDLCPFQPPPAHSSVNGQEYMTTDQHTAGHHPSSLTTKSLEISGCDTPASDQPTDLSLTYNGHEHENVSPKSSKKHCKIVSDFDQYDKDHSSYEGCCKNIGDACNTVILPKKRRFFAQGGETDSSGGILSEESKDNGVFSDFMEAKTAPRKEGESKDIEREEINRQGTTIMSSISKTDTQLCNVSYGAKEHEKNAKLKMLLQGDFSSTQNSTERIPYDVSMMTKDVYNMFPFQDNKTPNTLNHVTNGSFDRDVYTSPMKPQPQSESTLDDNIDRMIRTSVVSESYSDVLRMEARSNGSPKSKRDHAHFTFPPKSATLCSNSNSPKVMTPTPRRYSQTTSPSRAGSDVDMFRLVVAEKSLAAAAHGMHRISIEASSKGYLPTTMPALITGSSVVYSREEKPLAVSVPHLKGPPPLPASHHVKTTVTSSSFQVLENLPPHVTRAPCAAAAAAAEMIMTPSKGAGLLVDKTLRTAFSGGHSEALTAIPVTSVSLTTIQPGLNSPVLRTMASFYTGIHEDQWLATSDENSADFAARSSRPMRFTDLAGHPNYDLVAMETGDDKDGKGMKKRRYPTSRPFKCEHCSQAFNQRIHLKKHMSKHTGVKPFKCQQCEYSTVERSHLKVHYRIHTGEKPYRCAYCDYATAQNSTLKIHLKRHHEGIVIPRGRNWSHMSAREDSFSGSPPRPGFSTNRGIPELMAPRGMDKFSASPIRLSDSSLSSSACSGGHRRRRTSELDRSTHRHSDADGHADDLIISNGVSNRNKSIRLSSSSSIGDADDSSLSSTSPKTPKDLDTCAMDDLSKSTIPCNYSSQTSRTEGALDLSEHHNPFTKGQDSNPSRLKSKSHIEDELPHCHGSDSSPGEDRTKEMESPYLSECGASSCISKELPEAEVVAAAKASDPSLVADESDEDEVDDLDYRPSLLSVTIPDKAFVRG